MRVVTYTVARAFLMGKKKALRNTRTDGNTLYLHGNAIAKREDGQLYICDGGYSSLTTRDRLNGILSLIGHPDRVYQKRHAQYFGNREWNGEWTSI